MHVTQRLQQTTREQDVSICIAVVWSTVHTTGVCEHGFQCGRQRKLWHKTSKHSPVPVSGAVFKASDIIVRVENGVDVGMQLCPVIYYPLVDRELVRVIRVEGREQGQQWRLAPTGSQLLKKATALITRVYDVITGQHNRPRLIETGVRQKQTYEQRARD